VTAESALGLAGLFFVVLLFLQSFSLIVVYLQLQSATYEASQIASAFGSKDEQTRQAMNFLSAQVPNAETKVEIMTDVASATARQRIQIFALGFRIEATSTSARWDSL